MTNKYAKMKKNMTNKYAKVKKKLNNKISEFIPLIKRVKIYY